MRLARCGAGVAVDGDQARVACGRRLARRRCRGCGSTPPVSPLISPGERRADEIAGIAVDLDAAPGHARAGKPPDAPFDQRSRRRSCRGRRAGRHRRSRGCARPSCPSPRLSNRSDPPSRTMSRGSPGVTAKMSPSDSGRRVVRISSPLERAGIAASCVGGELREVAALRRWLPELEHQRAHPSSSPRW